MKRTLLAASLGLVLTVAGAWILFSLLFFVRGCARGIPHEGINTAERHAHFILLAVRQYEQEFGELPQGTTAEILRKLEGNNAKKIAYLDLASQERTPDGGWLDPQGTPYSITTTGTNLEVRSAGPDRKFGTADDIATP